MEQITPKSIWQLIQKKTSICAKTVPKSPKLLLFQPKKSETMDSKFKNSSVVGQIDRKKTKEKSRFFLKCFGNSFRKLSPISARNVTKLPEMSLFEATKRSTKMIAISKLAAILTATTERRILSYS